MKHCPSCKRDYPDSQVREICPNCEVVLTDKPPTNEPNMPEEVKLLVASDGELLFSISGTIYHHDDKVQELKNQLEGMVNGHTQDQAHIEKLEKALRECIEAMRATRIATRSIVEKAPAVQQLRLSKEADEKVEKAYTKASNLLK